MSELLYIPFDNQYAAEDFRSGTLRYMAESNAELNDACVITRTPCDQIHIQYPQVLTTRGLVGVEFWETLISAIFSNAPFERFNGQGKRLNLELYSHKSFIESMAKHLEVDRSAIMMILRKKNSYSSIQSLMAIRPRTLCISFSDEDDLAIQHEISRQLTAKR